MRLNFAIRRSLKTVKIPLTILLLTSVGIFIIDCILSLGDLNIIVVPTGRPPGPLLFQILPAEKKHNQFVLHALHIFNKLGLKAGDEESNPDLLRTLLDSEDYGLAENFQAEFWDLTLRARQIYEQFHPRNKDKNGIFSLSPVFVKHRRRSLMQNKIKINFATVVCGAGNTEKEAKVLLKSAVMFSQDAHLHLIIFGDEKILSLAQWLLELKWITNGRGWDFTFEIKIVSFPNQKWTTMFAPCACQRLFFPSALSELDAVIYMDSDTIVVSNLTEIWLQISTMNKYQVAALGWQIMPPASGVYQKIKNVPYYGETGLNTGLVLMNLTRMRDWKFEEKALGAHYLFRERMTMHDMDIFNIIFHHFPSKVMTVSCTVSFYSFYCGVREGVKDQKCLYETEEGPRCFCFPTLTEGVRVVNGNNGNFLRPDRNIFHHLFVFMSDFDMIEGSFAQLVQNLTKDYRLFHRPCFDLTAELMYKNARVYFENLQYLG